MATNLNLDPELVEAAKRAGHHRTKKAAVEAALEAYVRQRARVESLAAFGSFDLDAEYDYKAARNAR